LLPENILRKNTETSLYYKIASFIHCLHFSHRSQIKLTLNKSFCVVYLIHLDLLLPDSFINNNLKKTTTLPPPFLQV
jgi:hypothetical protein